MIIGHLVTALTAHIGQRSESSNRRLTMAIVTTAVTCSKQWGYGRAMPRS
jgi:hypothetical protein